jgi:hypothetical protein
MSKPNKSFKGDLTLNRSKVNKKSSFNPSLVESGVKQIHESGIPTKREEVKSKETIVKATVLLPKSLHKKLKIRTLDLETSISQYFIDLLKKDLEG